MQQSALCLHLTPPHALGAISARQRFAGSIPANHPHPLQHGATCPGSVKRGAVIHCDILPICCGDPIDQTIPWYCLMTTTAALAASLGMACIKLFLCACSCGVLCQAGRLIVHRGNPVTPYHPILAHEL